MNIQPVLTPPKKYITQHVGEHHQFQALLTAGTQKLRHMIVFQTFISGLSGLLSFWEVFQKGPMFQLAPPFWAHSCRKKANLQHQWLPNPDGTMVCNALVMPMWHMPNRSTKVHDNGLKQPSKLRWEEI